MAPLRLALAVPRFWPLIGDEPDHWLALAEALIAAGHTVIVVTPQWHRVWPRKMSIGSMPLVRLRGAPLGGWSTLRWTYALGKWLAAQPRFDAVIAAGLRHEAYVALGAAAKMQFPVVALACEGDLAWQQTATFGNRLAARCRQAPAIVAPCRALAEELAQQGYPPHAITVIERRVAISSPRSPADRMQSREALAAVNYDLATTSTAPVALALGRLDEQHRFGDLVKAWRIVSAHRSEARLWIVGDGPERERLFRQISDLDQRFRVLIPGTFDCGEELLAAADVLLVPGAPTVPPLALLQAQAAGLPVVAADSLALRDLIADGQNGLLHVAGDFRAIGAIVNELFDQPDKGIDLGARARNHALSLPTPAEEAAQYVSLIRSLGNR